MDGRPGFILFFDDFPALEVLEPKQFKEFVCALRAYAERSVEPVFDNATQKALFILFRSKIDRDSASYERRVEQRRNASRSRWGKASGGLRDNADASERNRNGDVDGNVTRNGDGNVDTAPDPRVVALEELKRRIGGEEP